MVVRYVPYVNGASTLLISATGWSRRPTAAQAFRHHPRHHHMHWGNIKPIETTARTHRPPTPPTTATRTSKESCGTSCLRKDSNFPISSSPGRARSIPLCLETKNTSRPAFLRSRGRMGIASHAEGLRYALNAMSIYERHAEAAGGAGARSRTGDKHATRREGKGGNRRVRSATLSSLAVSVKDSGRPSQALGRKASHDFSPCFGEGAEEPLHHNNSLFTQKEVQGVIKRKLTAKKQKTRQRTAA